MTSIPNESEDEFKGRCEVEADRLEDIDIEKVHAQFEKRIDRLKEKLRKEERELDADEARLASLKMETVVNYGEAIFNIAKS